MKSLNEAYLKSNQNQLEFHYWCNVLGEINPPNDSLRCGAPSDLPSDVRIIYQNLYESDKCGVSNYVVTIDHTPGIALTWLFCEDDGRIDFSSVTRAATEMEREFPFATVYVGENTDPEGHEILLFIPADYIRIFYRALPAHDIELGDKYYDMVYKTISRPKMYYAEIRWTIDDITAAAAEDGVILSPEQAAAWWEENERFFRESLTQQGNEVLSSVNWEKFQHDEDSPSR